MEVTWRTAHRSLYPDPPHVTVAVYPGVAEGSAFAELCAVVADAGCAPRGVFELVPWDRTFEWPSDLAEVCTFWQVGDDEVDRMLAGDNQLGRPIKAGYVHPQFGVVVVEYLGTAAGDRHPVGVSLGAGPQGMPSQWWSDADRRTAARMVEWTTQLLKAASRAVRASYGGIAEEDTLASPSALVQGRWLQSELFVSRTLLEKDDSLREVLREAFAGDAEAEWGHGSFYSGWGPYNRRGVTLPDIPTRFGRAAVALGRAVREI